MPTSNTSTQIAVVTGVDHFLGLHLSYALISKHLHVIGLPLHSENSPHLPAWLTDSPLFQLYTGYPSLSELHNISSTLYGHPPTYLFHSNFYASHLLSSELTPSHRLALLHQALGYIGEAHQFPVKLCFITPANFHLASTPPPTSVFAILQQLMTSLGPLSQSSVNIRFTNLHDCYGSYMNLQNHQPFTQVLSLLAGNTNTSITLPLSQRFTPLHVADAINGILKATFSPHTQHQHFYFLGKEIYSSETLIKTLQQHYSHLRQVRLIPEANQGLVVPDHHAASQTSQFLHWQPHISLPTGLQEFLRWANPSLQIANPLLSSTTPLPIPSQLSQLLTTLISRFQPFLRFCTNKLSYLKITSYFPMSYLLYPKSFSHLAYARLALASFLIIVGLFGVGTAALIFRNSYLIQQTLTQLANNRWAAAAEQAAYLDQHYQQLTTALKPLAVVSYLPVLRSGYQTLFNHFQTIALLGQTTTQLAQLALQGDQLGRAIFTPAATSDPRVVAADIDLHLHQTYQQASLLQGQLSQTSPSLLQFFTNHPFEYLTSQLTHTRQQLLQADQLLDKLRLLLHASTPQTLAVVFQDPRELRPTGGFINWVLIATINNGKFTDWHVYDVYETDNQLLGQVDPPPALQTQLGETSWYLRDANWDPDFPTTAKQLSWFIDKELNRSADIILAIDSDLFKSLANQISLPPTAEFPQTVSAFIKHLQQQPEINWLQLATLLKSALDRKQALAYFTNPQVQQTSRQFGWSGALSQIDVASAELDSATATFDVGVGEVLGSAAAILNDHLFIVEANVGNNQANQNLTRTIRHEIQLSVDQDLREILHLYYTNMPGFDNSPGLTYKNYLRLYLQPGTVLDEITIHTPDTAIPTQTPSLEKVDQTQEHGYQVYGFLLEIPSSQQQHLQVNYHNSVRTADSDIETYRLYLRKQPGTSNDPYQLQLTYPEAWQPTNTQVTAWPVLTNSSASSKSVLLPADLSADSSSIVSTEEEASLPNGALAKSEAKAGLTNHPTLTYNITLTQDHLVTISFNKQKIKSL